MAGHVVVGGGEEEEEEDIELSQVGLNKKKERAQPEGIVG